MALMGLLPELQIKRCEFGGYLDIVCDFCVYSVVPIGLLLGSTERTEGAWFTLCMLEGCYFVNAASLFMLSAIIERRGQRSQNAELTVVALPKSFIEGAETLVVYQLFFLFPSHLVYLMSAFAVAVALTIVHRVHWASCHLQ